MLGFRFSDITKNSLGDISCRNAVISSKVTGEKV